MTYEDELNEKQRRLAQVLGISLEAITVIPAPRTESYRSRLLLRIHAHERQLGFFAAGSRTLVNVENCLVASPSLNTVIGAVRRILAEGEFTERYRLHIQQVFAGGDESAIAHLMPAQADSRELEFLAERLRRDTPLAHVTTGPHMDEKRFV